VEPSSEAEHGLVDRSIQRVTDLLGAARQRHTSVDVALTAHDRDGEVGGSILAGALAYRLFLWLLPYVLVLIAALGVAADTADETPEQTAEAVGLSGLVSTSIAQSATSSGRWYALLIGVPVLFWMIRSLLRSLIGVHRLVWSDVRERVAKPTALATVRLLIWLVVVMALLPLAKQALPSVFAVVVAGCLYALFWLVLTVYLPHRVTPWTALVPGALLFGAGAELIAVFTTYVLGPYASSRESTYGTLGLAAALLLSLFFISRLIVVTAVLNATLWERRAS
jgi:uncharacterized BrkB/YihY/UPF0761 family membrane protein